MPFTYIGFVSSTTLSIGNTYLVPKSTFNLLYIGQPGELGLRLNLLITAGSMDYSASGD